MIAFLRATLVVFVLLSTSVPSVFSQVSTPRSSNPISTIRDLKSLRSLGSAAIGKKVNVQATVTLVEPVWHYIFIQDGTDAIYVKNLDAKELEVGDRVQVKGRVVKGDVNVVIEPASVTKIGAGKLPQPHAVDMSVLQIGDFDARYISTKAKILQAVSSQGHTIYLCEDKGVQFHASILGGKSLNDLWEMVGAEVEFIGALGVTLEAGTESDESKVGIRRIERLRVLGMNDPRIIATAKLGKLPVIFNQDSEQTTFLFDGQISAQFDDFFTLTEGTESKRIDCEDSGGIAVARVVRLAGERSKDSNGNWNYKVRAMDSLFSTRLPNTVEFQKIPPKQRTWQRVKVSGAPENIRLKDGRVCFDIACEGQTANIELRDLAFTNPDLLNNTGRMEVTGTVTNCDHFGNCDIIVAASQQVLLLEPIVPVWKYVSWFLLPVTALFSIGYVVVKIQRNQVASQAASICKMHTRLVSTYQAISDGLLAVDDRDRVLSVNDQFCELIGDKLKVGDDFRASSCRTFLDRTKNRILVEDFIFNQSENRDSDRGIELELESPEPKTFDLRMATILDKDKTNIGRLLIMRDKTSERQLQAELIHANKIEAVGQLVGGIAHNFNNILTTITANLSLLNLEADLDSSVLEKVNDAELASNRGRDLVQRLLTYSGKGELKPKPHSINSIVRQLHKFSRATFDSRYQFYFDLDDVDPYVHVDAGAIEQVMLNLCLNARDAMPNGGKITTRTRLRLSNGQPAVFIWISDTGHGIDDSVRGEIFDPFFTTKAGRAGTGLGLSTSKRLIIDQHGSLECEPNTGTGSCFVIKLPAARAPIDQEQPHEAETLTTINDDNKTILVVDDEDAIRKICSLILSSQGFRVLTAVSGEAALEVLRAKKDEIDLVLLDLTMPGISGLEVAEIAAIQYPDIPLVICSGYLAGISGVIGDKYQKLPKPFSAKQLLAIVGDSLQISIADQNERS